MKTCNIIALSAFIIAKILGICGVSVGFIHRSYGGFFLASSAFLLLCSIMFACYQLFDDRREIELENSELNQLQKLRQKKQELQWQIEELESQKLKYTP